MWLFNRSYDWFYSQKCCIVHFVHRLGIYVCIVVAYTLLCEPTWRLIAHAAKDGVQFLYGMRWGEGFRLYSVWLNQLLLRVQKPLAHYSGCQSYVQNITYSHLGASFTITMPFRFSFAEYADMIYVYGFCDGNLVHAIAEYQKCFPNRTSHGISHLISTRIMYFMHQR